ncbi:MAG: addiction module protein [Bacteroidota bacterium]
MTNIQLRQKLHRFIDTAEEKKLKAIYTIVESDIEQKSLLTDEQKSEIDQRLEEYMQGKGKNYSLKSAMNRIRKKKK